jgi:glycerate dehydrogenase
MVITSEVFDTMEIPTLIQVHKRSVEHNNFAATQPVGEFDPQIINRYAAVQISCLSHVAANQAIHFMSTEPPRIVVLDGWTTNPGDLSWQPLEELGEVTVHDRTLPDQLIERAQGAAAVFGNKSRMSRDVIAKLPDLKFIGVLATGYDVIDVEAATEHGVTVTNVPAYSTQSVAQMAIAHVLNFTQHVAQHAEAVRERRWSECPDFSFWEYPLIELDGLAMGIVGFGRIGQATAEIARALGMDVLAYNPSPRDAPSYVQLVDLDTVFRESDFVSLHCPLNDQSRHIVDEGRLRLMKPTAYLINTARGALIDDQALAAALREKRIAGAGLDVLVEEPPPADHVLFGIENCYITPHMGWATQAARKRLLETSVANLKAFLEGRPVNVVNG